MFGFCGCLDFGRGVAELSALKKMSGLYGVGCAFINKEYGILCDGVNELSDTSLQPVTVSYNNSLYTAAVVCDGRASANGSVSRAVLEGYLEEGDEYIRRLDFPYALALYDGRCGELLLAKGHTGDKPLFYTMKDGAVYFASSLRPLIRLYGGCVRVNKAVLLAHLGGAFGTMPEGLFFDIKPLKVGYSLLCTRLGQSVVPTLQGVYPFEGTGGMKGDAVALSYTRDVRRTLTDALFAFGYPQFDCYMPSVAEYLDAAKTQGIKRVCMQDRVLEISEEYSAERADRLGALFGVEITAVSPEDTRMSKRALKSMERELDAILSEYMSAPNCILHRLSVSELIKRADEEKSIPLRIRKKSMLCQTAMWFESFDLVLI